MLTAACLPAPMALTTVWGPVTASPPAKTPGRLVLPDASVAMPPHLSLSMPVVVSTTASLYEVPVAMTRLSQSTSKNSPVPTGRRRPDSSGSPSTIFSHLTPVRTPSLL